VAALQEKELLGVLFCLRAFATAQNWSNTHLRVRTDNITCMLYINRAGGRVPSLFRIVDEMVQFMQSRGLTLSATFLPGKMNEMADEASRVFNFELEAMLSPMVFDWLDSFWGPHSLDAFASFSNAQVQAFVSRYPDPESQHVDFFSVTAPEGNLWLFPPFACLNKTLAKVRDEELQATIVVPLWPSRPFWPLLLALLADWPILIPKHSLQPPRGISRGLASMTFSRAQLVACRVCGAPSRRREFQTRLSSSPFNTSRWTTQDAMAPSQAMISTFGSTLTSEEMTQALQTFSRSLT